MANASQTPLVSILIPVYNREALISRAIMSALNQTYPEIEIIAVDNHSSDRTWEVIEQYASRFPRIRCARNPENIGPIRNWKRCLELSRGEYIKFLYSDDELDPKAVETLLKPLQTDPDIGFSYSSVNLIDINSQILDQMYSLKNSGRIPVDFFLAGSVSQSQPLPVSPGCALFYRDTVIKALETTWEDPFDLGCCRKGFGPDLLMFLYACEQRPFFYHFNHPLAHFRTHPDSITDQSKNKSPELSKRCYRFLFASFLDQTSLSRQSKRKLRTLLLLVTLFSKNYLEESKISQYAALIPDKRQRWEISLFDRSVLAFLISRLRYLQRR